MKAEVVEYCCDVRRLDYSLECHFEWFVLSPSSVLDRTCVVFPMNLSKLKIQCKTNLQKIISEDQEGGGYQLLRTILQGKGWKQHPIASHLSTTACRHRYTCQRPLKHRLRRRF